MILGKQMELDLTKYGILPKGSPRVKYTIDLPVEISHVIRKTAKAQGMATACFLRALIFNAVESLDPTKIDNSSALQPQPDFEEI